MLVCFNQNMSDNTLITLPTTILCVRGKNTKWKGLLLCYMCTYSTQCCLVYLVKINAYVSVCKGGHHQTDRRRPVRVKTEWVGQTWKGCQEQSRHCMVSKLHKIILALFCFRCSVGALPLFLVALYTVCPVYILIYCNVTFCQAAKWGSWTGLLQLCDAILSKAGGLHETGVEEDPRGECCISKKGSGWQRANCRDGKLHCNGCWWLEGEEKLDLESICKNCIFTICICFTLTERMPYHALRRT